MAQKIINVGTVANDGTGDTIRGAFSNVNVNFTELYSNLTIAIPAYNTANAAFAETNTVNSLLQTAAVSANLYSNDVGTASNAYSLNVATSIGTSGNTFTISIGAASNTWANTYASTVGLAGNNYASLLAANNAAGSNAWANAVGTAGNNWVQTNFTTLTNTATIFNTTNASFSRANTAFQNSSGVFAGDLTISGFASSLGGFSDALGDVRERFTVTTTANVTANSAHLTYIANNISTIYVNIPDDNAFIVAANIGTTIEVIQFGTGVTKIVANDAAVTVHSSNNWANIAGQYLTASAIKVLPNTWILTGDLKP